MTRERGNENIEGRRGLRKFLDTRKGGSEKIVGLRWGGSENLYTAKPTHNIIIKIGRFSTQKFSDLCNLAISRCLQMHCITNVVSVIITLLFIPKLLYKISKIRNAQTFYNKTTSIQSSLLEIRSLNFDTLDSIVDQI